MVDLFDKGDKVLTPGGTGVVSWRRMAGPDYSQAASYSVMLDSELSNPRYNGTVYPADKVTKA